MLKSLIFVVILSFFFSIYSATGKVETSSFAVAESAAESSSDCVTSGSGIQGCPRRCKPTCSEPNPRSCKPNQNCSCKIGYIYPNKRNNTCIPIYECPQTGGCNGDKNAVIQDLVLSCRSTCQDPNQGFCESNSITPTYGCVCKPGYILSRKGGKCIPINSCPGGNPCGQNRTFVSCSSCPYNPCPFSDTPVMYPCDPVWPCPSGCICQSEYKSFDGKCILPQDCPPVVCTRPNETWDRCPSPCYSDYCYDVPLRTAPCNTLVAITCDPQCRCQPGYARDSGNGVCIPIEQCPPVNA